MAATAGGAADWSTVVVEGFAEAPGLHRVVWFEWVATVRAENRNSTR